ncbi:MAG TPA: amino acid adenylation domain-containing protein, partial [Thermoanaerobaculia bacterium]|nr:amino acid adenylation domain-containing protein [Thermoanaerobaculia bacterium]
GYLGRPELTAELFVPDDRSGAPGGRQYRTGDVVRWDGWGRLEFLGRRDQQVKVRGFRIELREIETVLAEHPSVSQAVALVRQVALESASDRQIVAYVVPAEGVAAGKELEQELWRNAGKQLPSYMVPARVIVVSALPLTPAGKVDRQALAARTTDREEGAESDQVAPRTPYEELVAQIWEELLGRERVGVTESFFELGGHSLLATQVISRMSEVFKVELPLRQLFENPTVEGVARAIEEAQRTGLGRVSPPIERAERVADLPLSFAQERLWFIDQLDPGRPTYNMPLPMQVNGPLNPAVLARSVDRVVERHEALRTRFESRAGRPVQVIDSPGDRAAAWVDLGGLAVERREMEIRRLAKEERWRPFDLERGPLLRVTLLEAGVEDWRVLFTMHHIISDGWSLEVLVREVSALYGALVQGEEPVLPALPIQYADFAVWQRGWLSGDVLANEIAYWREQLEGVPPVLELPLDRPRQRMQGISGERRSLVLPAGLAERLRAQARREGATFFMVMLATWQILLGRLAGAERLAVGTPIAGRNRLAAENLIGFFVNTLVMPADLSGGPSFQQFMGRCREVCLGAFTHQDLPFEKLVEELRPERSLANSPLFQVMFTVQSNPSQKIELPGLSLSPLAGMGSEEGATSRFDLEIAIQEGQGRLGVGLTYNRTLFDATTAERLLGQLALLLSQIVAETQAEVFDLALLSASQRHQLTIEWNSAEALAAHPYCLHERIEEQVRLHPEETALECGGEEVSYAELNRRANRMAHRLRSLGVGPESRVGLFVERSVRLVVGILGIFKSGGVFVPLDPSDPADRLSYIVADSGISLLVREGEGLEELPENLKLVRFGDEEGEPAADPASWSRPESLAYLIYTSGTTGRPKGVMVEHRQVVHTLRAAALQFGLEPGDRMTCLASFSFDIFLFELILPLLSGARALLLRREEVLSPTHLTAAIERSSHLHAVPSLMRQIVETLRPKPLRRGELRAVFVGGETVEEELLQGMREVLRPARLEILYGPTEATIICASHRVPALPEPGRTDGRRLGRPLSEVRLQVMDARGLPVPVGVGGELWVGGAGVSRGYLGRPELTAESFVPDLASGVPGARSYRTGDVVRWDGTGRIEFLGRRDQQVKVRGFRIEPGEVESVLKEHPGVKEAVVVALAHGGDKRLVGYVVSRAEEKDLSSALRVLLANRLPSYMVPSAFVFLESLPLTEHGKLDRRSLPEPQWGNREHGDFGAPRTEAERLLAQIFVELLKVDRVGVRDNFFELGGDSILSIQLVARAARLGYRITARQVFENPVLGDLAAVADRVETSKVDQGVVTGPVVLTPVQRLFLESDPVDVHHFNQSVLLRVEPSLSPAVAERAWEALMQHHDALRLRFERVVEGWRQWNQGLDSSGSGSGWTRVDLSGVPTGVSEELESLAGQVQSSLDLARGPIARGVWFSPVGEEARLLLVVHHLAVDGVSWRVLLEDFATACGQLAAGGEAVLPAKTTAYQQWAESLAAYAASWEPTALASDLGWWHRESSAPVTALAVDFPVEENRAAQARMVSVSLSAEDTRGLVQEIPSVYRTRIEDVLLTALARALVGPRQAVRVRLEGHGREELSGVVDLSRTVGWFTSVYPVRLEAGGSDVGQALQSIKEHLRSIPGRGQSWGLLRYLREEGARELVGTGGTEVSFNYLGQLDVALPTGAPFKVAPENAGPMHSPRAKRQSLLDINAVVMGGCLRVSWIYGQEVHHRRTVESWAERFLVCLRELILHCRSRLERRIGGYTPADFPLARLGQAELERLLGSEWGIEEVYPLSPLQEGMLFETLFAPGSGVYVDQLLCRVAGHLDEVALERACQWTLDRHPILRTSFHGRDLGRALQVVHGRVAMSLESLDWRSLSAGETKERLAGLVAADRKRGFDVSRAPLMRWTAVRTGETEHWLLWTHHHVLLDGWSLSAVTGEFLGAYRALHLGEESKAVRRQPYRDYIAWLESRDLAETEQYWRRALAGWSEPTPLVAGLGRGEGHDKARRVLAESLSAALQGQARHHQLTLNTLVQGAWGLLLGRWGGVDDVVYGATVSGRPADLAGVEGMVGLFINTLPVRLRLGEVAPGPRLSAWLRDLQSEQLELRQHEHSPLVKVQSWSEIPRGRPLFETILAFENYPVDESIRRAGGGEGGLEIVEVVATEQPHYPLSLSVMPGEVLRLTLDYARGRFDASSASRMLGHLETVLGGMARSLAEGGGTVLRELPLLSEEESHQALHEWNDADSDFPREACVHELFEEWVRLQPERLAVEFGDERISYGELNRRANRLAHRLRTLGVGTESRVGLFVERSVRMVAGMLGILKSGGAYVPLDTSYPLERLSVMVEDARVSVLVSAPELLSLKPETQELVLLGEEEAEPAEDLASLSRPESLAYVTFTSGSTGRPKGIGVSHRAVVRLVEGTNYIDLGPQDRMAQVSNVTFDAATFEVWGALLRGGMLVGIPREVVLAPALFAQSLKSERVSAMFLTAALFNETARQAPDAFSGVRHLLVGGEALDPLWTRQVLEAGRPQRLLNAYGPTEATTFSAWHLIEEVEEGTRTIPIGRPLANARLYVADGEQRPAPMGIAGELLIGGEGLARGYEGRSDLTAASFVPDGFGGEPGGRLYRTGDLVRWDGAGRLLFLGRRDQQVKLRGFRIELSEIEAVLSDHPSIAQAVALVQPVAREGWSDRHLVAYVVPHETPSSSRELSRELRQHLESRLPPYMVPAQVIVVPDLPLTPTGKVDRQALALRNREESESDRVAPRTPYEELVAQIWEELLGRAQVSVTESFFELGGHSLLATQITSRVSEAFRVELPLRELFENPTVAGLARAIEEAQRSRSGLGRVSPPLERVERVADLPLSFAEERLWFIDQLDPGRPTYNMPLPLSVCGRLDPAVLAQSLSQVVERHETLRTRFESVGGRPVQVIDPPGGHALSSVDLGELAAHDLAREVRRLAREESWRPFDLARGPLLRTTLLRIGVEDWRVLFTMHHIVSDGWSLEVLVREVSSFYAGSIQGAEPALPELPIQYADFAAWQRGWLAGEVLAAEIAYWRERLAGVPQVLELPLDRPRQRLPGPSGAHRSRVLKAELSHSVRALARREGATLFMVLLAAWQSLLGRLAGTERLAVGTPIAGRNRRQTEGLIGFFVNTLVMPADLSGAPSFQDLVRRCREVCLGAFEHQDLPFEKLVEELRPERNLSRSPLFQVTFSLQNPPAERLDIPGLALSRLPVGEEIHLKFDLELEMTNQRERIGAALVYDPALFDQTTAARWLTQLERLLTEIAVEPARRVVDLSLLSPAEDHQVRLEWNDAAAAFPREATVHERFEARVFLHPDRPAAEFGEAVGYGELNRRANRLAHRLRALGVGPEGRVGLLVERSIGLVVGMLGILKSGGAYVPLDPSYPAERLAMMVEDAGVRVLVSEPERLGELPETPELVLLGEEEEEPDADLTSWSWPESLAYVTFTSGSTGRPKGIGVSHQSVVRLVEGTNYVDLGPEDRVAQLSNVTFDGATFEVWGALLCGGVLVGIPREVALAPARFAESLRQERVSAMFLTTALFNQMAREAPAAFGALRYLLFGGEAVEPRWAAEVLEKGRPGRLLHVYGPTEATTFSTWHGVSEVAAGTRTIPIGRALANARTYVVGESQRPVPVGVMGELLIGGEGLARGYEGRPDLTAASFVPDGLSGERGERLYRTGDLVRWNGGGSLEFLGRRDQQVKVRGFRIELAEIEAVLTDHPGVDQAAALVQQVAREGWSDRDLVAYVVPHETVAAGPELSRELRRHAEKRLPSYMVPARVMVVPDLPLTPAGKVDRQALAERRADCEARGKGDEVAPRTPYEELVAQIWEELLGREQVGVTESFFELGGHSLLATQVISRVSEAFQVELPLRQLFENPTVESLARAIEQAQREGRAMAVPPIERIDRTSNLLPSFAQERLWFLHQLDPQGIAYNQFLANRATGDLDVRVLWQSLSEIERRHEVLRTVFAVVDGQPFQRIHAAPFAVWWLVDLSALPADRVQALIPELAAAEARRLYDLASGPLFRFGLVREDARQHITFLSMHHVISDEWSLRIFSQELATFYRAFAQRRPPALPDLPVQYVEYAHWQRSWLCGEVLAAQIAYWRECLADVPEVLDLPLDRPRPRVQVLRGAIRSRRLSAELSQSLHKLARQEKVTQFMVLLAGWQALLGRLAGAERLAVGTPIAGRNRLETEGLIGFFVNTLVIPADLSAAPSFRELLGRCREVCLGAFEHQDLPFEKLVEELRPERSLSHSPLFQVMFSLQSGSPAERLELPGLSLSRLGPEEASSLRFDLELTVQAQEGGMGRVLLTYNRQLFDTTTAHRLLDQLARLWSEVATEPQALVLDLALLSAPERHQLTVEWSPAASLPLSPACLHELIEERALLQPEDTALECNGEEVGYGELNRRANRLAHRLRRLGVGPESRVGLFVERSAGLVVGLLGIFKSGGVFVPLDPSYPLERLSYIVADAGISVLISEPERLGELPDTPVLVLLGEEEEEPAENPASWSRPESLAYLIYTSGTSGRPKG